MSTLQTVTTFQTIFEQQKRHFASGVTRRYDWRVEQLDRMAQLVSENEPTLQRAIAQDFKTASQEQMFETLACLGEVAFQKSQLKDWMAPVEAPVPRALAASGHRGVIYRDPYGVALIIGPFNGPLLLLLRPAITALAAGNCCVLKLSMALKATSSLLLDLVPKYFNPEAVAAVAGHRDEITELLKLPFDFIFFTGSTSTGKVIARAAAENLTPVLLELGGKNPAQPTSLMRPGRSPGARWPGADNGARLPVTPTCTNPWPRHSWPSPRRPCSPSTGRIRNRTQTTPASSAHVRCRGSRR
jgi:acyl-CoA reductase-like NAD-dependent aldehyde dehydrogenase